MLSHTAATLVTLPLPVAESFLIIFVVEPFEHDGYDFNLVLSKRIQEPPAVRKVVLPEVVYSVFACIFFCDKLLSYVDDAMGFSSISLNALIRLS